MRNYKYFDFAFLSLLPTPSLPPSFRTCAHLPVETRVLNLDLPTEKLGQSFRHARRATNAREGGRERGENHARKSEDKILSEIRLARATFTPPPSFLT